MDLHVEPVGVSFGRIRTQWECDYQPATLYGHSKVETERIVRRSDGGGITWSLVRPTTIWGPGMNAHYLRFFRMIQTGRYFHVGGGPRFKSYGYVGNTAWQYLRLAKGTGGCRPPSNVLSRRLRTDLAGGVGRRLQGGGPCSDDSNLAPVGCPGRGPGGRDWLNSIGLRRFPFNSFRLANVLAEYVVELGPTRAVCGELPFTMHAGSRRRPAGSNRCGPRRSVPASGMSGESVNTHHRSTV